MDSFRSSLAWRTALGVLLLFVGLGAASVLVLRSLLSRQLDRTLLHLAEVEAQAGAAHTGPEFQFHEGVLLAAREGPSTELTRYAQLWGSDGRPLIRTRNLSTDLELPAEALAAAQRGEVGWATHQWRGRTIRSVVYPLELVGAAHGVHLLQVAAPTDAVLRTVVQFTVFMIVLSFVAAAGAYGVGWRLAGVALRPTREITDQAEAIRAGTLSERITAHADVEEFSRLVTVLNGMLDRLEETFESQRRFTADASHELRAPLNVLRGDIEVTLRRERSAEEYRAALERCHGAVVHLARLIGDLLVLARSDAGVLLVHREPVDLNDVVHGAVERLGAMARAGDVKLSVRGQPAPVAGDPGVLDRMVGNLVENAVKYSPRGGTITVEVDRKDGTVALTVRDEGPGIPPEHVPHLFTRFYRGDPARAPEEGTGLGLAIAHAGALAHGGRLTFVGNDPGALFKLDLPAASQDAARTSGREARIAEAVRGNTR